MSAAPTRATPRRRRALVALLAASFALLSACAALPRQGPVLSMEPHLPAPVGADFFAGSPVAGASPREIVQGFLNAQTAGYADEGFAVAREFLTAHAAAQWDPTARARVYADGTTFDTGVADDGAIVVDADIIGEIDAEGRYAELPRGADSQLRFTLVRDQTGEWRIATLEDGVLLSQYISSVVFSAQPLYFYTQDRAALVPELRWFPQENLATHVVNGLLAGPSEQLAGVTANDIPPGTTLTSRQVEIADGVASLDLSPELANLPEPQRTLAGTQIERSLFAVATVREVAITSGGEDVVMDASRSALTSYPMGGGNPPLVGLSDGAVVEVEEGQLRELASEARLGAVQPSDVAVSYDESQVALLDEGQRLVIARPEEDTVATMLTAQRLTPPTIDRHGWVWTGAEDGGLHAVSPAGAVRTVSAPFLEGFNVTDVAVSREGARIMVVIQDASETRVLVHGIERDETGGPVSLESAGSRIGTALISVEDVTWVEDAMVGILGRSDSTAAESAVHLVQVGGATRKLPLVEGATHVTAARGQRSLIVSTEDEQFWVRLGDGWRAGASQNISALAYPG